MSSLISIATLFLDTKFSTVISIIVGKIPSFGGFCCRKDYLSLISCLYTGRLYVYLLATSSPMPLCGTLVHYPVHTFKHHQLVRFIVVEHVYSGSSPQLGMVLHFSGFIQELTGAILLVVGNVPADSDAFVMTL